MKNTLKSLLFSVICFTLATGYFRLTSTESGESVVPFTASIQPVSESQTVYIDRSSPPCLQMHYAIEKYAEEYGIPLNYAYGIAYCETRYGGPFDWDYNHAQTSYAGAIGPMQIMPSTAEMMWPKEDISKTQLMNDIDFNVKTSMKLLRHLHDRYHDWPTVFGCYNTGRPCVNDYARNVYNYRPKFKAVYATL